MLIEPWWSDADRKRRRVLEKQFRVKKTQKRQGAGDYDFIGYMIEWRGVCKKLALETVQYNF